MKITATQATQTPHFQSVVLPANPETKSPAPQMAQDSFKATEQYDVHPMLDFGVSTFIGAASGFGMSAHGYLGAGLGARAGAALSGGSLKGKVIGATVGMAAGFAAGSMFTALAGSNHAKIGANVTATAVGSAAAAGGMSYLFAGLATANPKIQLGLAAAGAAIAVGGVLYGASKPDMFK